MLLCFPALSFTNTLPHKVNNEHTNQKYTPSNPQEMNRGGRSLLNLNHMLGQYDNPQCPNNLYTDDVIEDETKPSTTVLTMDDVIYDEYVSQNITVPQQENPVHSIYFKKDILITQ